MPVALTPQQVFPLAHCDVASQSMVTEPAPHVAAQSYVGVPPPSAGVKQQMSPVEQVCAPQVTPVPTHPAPRHATQRCVVVLHSGRPATPVQSLPLRHCTQEPLLVSQTGPAATPVQFALPRHWTQTPVCVLQWPVGPAQVASDVHLFTHACVVVLQTWPLLQFPSVRHATHVSVAGLQCVRPPGWPVQFVSDVHCTQVNEFVSHAGRPGLVEQFALPRQATQVPLAVSQ